MKVTSTTNYALFLSPSLQRDIDRHKVERIKQSMRERGFIRAKHINVRQEGAGKLRIIAGQHRFLAAKELGIEIWYVIDNDLSDHDAIEADQGVTWTRGEVIQAWADNGNPHYAYLLRFAREHGISRPFAAALLLGNAALANRGSWVEDLNAGKFTIVDQKYAMAVVSLAKEFEPYIKWWNETLWMRALAGVMKVEGFSQEILAKRIKSNASLLGKRRTISEYVHLIEEVYNSRSRASDRLNIHFLWEQNDRNQKVRNIEKARSVRLSDEQARSKAASSPLRRLLRAA